MGEVEGKLARESLSRRQFLVFGAASAGALGVAAVSLSGCGAPSATVSSTLRVGWITPPDVLNPFTFTTTSSNEILWLIYDTLMEYNLSLAPEPSLAAKQSMSADGKSFTYHLRHGATWHDGTPFSAHDVKYTFDVMAKHNLGQAAWSLADYDTTEIVSPSQIVIKYKVPQAFDPALAIPIVPEHIWGPMSPSKILSYNNPHPIGTGPYRFKKWVSGQYLQVDRNAKWWGTAPAVKSIIWNQYENSDVMVQSLSSGQLDILTEVPPVLWNGLKGKANVKAVEMESFSFHQIGINVSTNPKSGGNELLLDKTVRQALSYSLSRSQLVKLALAGHGIPGSVQLPDSFGQWQEKIPKPQLLDNNPVKARSMLDAAGYKVGPNGIRQDKHGTVLSFRLIAIATTGEDVLAGQIFVKAAQAVGIKLTLETLDGTTLSNIVYNNNAPNWDIFIWGWDSGTPDPDYLMSVPLSNQIGNNNDVYYSNKSYDALYNKQARTPVPAERVPLVHDLQRLFYEDCAYIVMWYQSKLQAYRTDTWKGWVPTRGGMIYNFTRDNYLKITPK
jgi:peptide/nickel transport system substrate-binding protein